MERITRRERERLGDDSEECRRIIAAAVQAQPLTEEPLTLNGVEVLKVDTNAGYNPNLDEILEFLTTD
jgi:hypothetical protein